MGNMLVASVTIRGVRPLFWHHFGPDALPLEKQEQTGVPGNDPEEWRKTVLVTRDGQLYLEPTYAFGSLRDAARYTRKGRGSIQTALSATLQILDDRILVDRYFPGFPNGRPFDVKTADPPKDDAEEPVYLDIRSVKNPATKGRNVRYRVAASLGWSATFRALWDKTIVSRGEFESVLRDAGTLVGIGDGRSVGFGRFEVVACDISDYGA